MVTEHILYHSPCNQLGFVQHKCTASVGNFKKSKSSSANYRQLVRRGCFMRGGASASTLILFVLSLMTQRLNGPYRELISSSLQLGSLKSIWMFYGFLKDI